MSNSKEEVPFISISNSKSNSSKNQNSKNSKSSSNIVPISMLQNNNSCSNSKKNSKHSSSNKTKRKISISEEEKSGIFFINDNFLIQPSSFKQENKSLSEDKKEVKTDKIYENKTPKKDYDKAAVLKEKLKDKKKAIMKMDNIPGKNLMEYFDKMSVKVMEDKSKKRVSSVENISYDFFRLKKNINDINKSWIKNNYPIFNSLKKPIKINNKYNKNNNVNPKEKKNVKDFNIIRITKKKSTSCVSKSAIKNFENIFKKNNINIDFENLLNKYMPNLQKNFNKNNKFNLQSLSNNKNNNNLVKNKLNTEKKVNIEKNKTTPKSDSYKRKFSSSYIKIKEISHRNLFYDFKPKQNEMNNLGKNVGSNSNKKRLSAKIITRTKPVISPMLKGQKNKHQNFFDKIINKNNLMKINPIKKEQKDNKNNIKKINNHNEINSYLFKNREKHDLPKQNEKGNQPINKGINYKSKNTKK